MRPRRPVPPTSSRTYAGEELPEPVPPRRASRLRFSGVAARVLLTAAVVAIVNVGHLWKSGSTHHNAIAIGDAPAAVTEFCRSRAREVVFPVLCPTRYPTAPHSDVTDSGADIHGQRFYWASFNDSSGFGQNLGVLFNSDFGHLVIGGQDARFSLAGKSGQSWPRPGEAQPMAQLQLPRPMALPRAGQPPLVVERPPEILQRTLVGDRPALVLTAESSSLGGFMRGHLIVIWNVGGHGYLLSFHYQGPGFGRQFTQADRLAAALIVANSYSGVTA